MGSLQDKKAIDKLADQFEQEFRAGQQPKIEKYRTEIPLPLRSEILRELLTLEVELRRSAGEQPGPEEYRSRFPENGSIIEAVFFPATELASTLDGANDTELEDEEPLPEQLGRYVIRRRLGKGGFGVVYLAHDSQLDRAVALKVPKQERFQCSEQVASFLDEARTAARLKHPFLVAVHDVQVENGLPYIVQEFIEGENLAAWAAKNKPTFQQIARVLVDITEALGYAHRLRLTHCDLKLANVLMDQQDQPHIADFGLAVHESAREFRKHQRFGTPFGMAPEQVRGEGHRLDGRTDIWAVGVMMYELLASQKPFTANNQNELFNEIETLDPRPPRQINPAVPRALENTCLKCLSKNRIDRFNTVDDLRDEILSWLSCDTSSEKLIPSLAEQNVGVATDLRIESQDKQSLVGRFNLFLQFRLLRVEFKVSIVLLILLAFSVPFWNMVTRNSKTPIVVELPPELPEELESRTNRNLPSTSIAGTDELKPDDDGELTFDNVKEGLASIVVASGHSSYAAMAMYADPGSAAKENLVLELRSEALTITHNGVSFTSDSDFIAFNNPQNQPQEIAQEFEAEVGEIGHLITENVEQSYVYLIALNSGSSPQEIKSPIFLIQPSLVSAPQRTLKFSFPMPMAGQELLILINARDELAGLDQWIDSNRTKLDSLLNSVHGSGFFSNSSLNLNRDQAGRSGSGKLDTISKLESLRLSLAVAALKIDMVFFPVIPKLPAELPFK